MSRFMHFSFDKGEYLGRSYYGVLPSTDALQLMHDCKHLVIYCGAGVSMDLTRTDWLGLVAGVVDRLKDTFEHNASIVFNDMREQLNDYLVKNKEHPLEVASVVTYILNDIQQEHQERQDSAFDAKELLINAIGETLYNRRPPYVTPLMNMVVGLTSSLLNKDPSTRVTLITTNYDDYLERELISAHQVYQETVEGKPTKKKRCPPRILVNDDKCKSKLQRNTDRNTLIYLHGRIPSASGDKDWGRDQGSIVFTERDYFEHKKSTADIIDQATRKADCFLILGSSMDDTPLTDWIQVNAQKPKRPRVILIQPLSVESYANKALTDKDRDRLVYLNWRRYSELGVDLYLPTRCFSDVPHILRDFFTSITAEDVKKISLTRDSINRWGLFVSKFLKSDLDNEHNNHSRSYNAELTSANSRSELLVRDALHEKLANNSAGIQKAIHSLIGEVKADTGVSLEYDIRIELWLRGAIIDNDEAIRDASSSFVADNPPTPPTKPNASYSDKLNFDYLVRVADSTSVLRELSSARYDRYSRRFPSRLAAMRACQFGQPDFTTLSTLKQDNSASRWQAFFTSPFFGSLETPPPAQTKATSSAATRSKGASLPRRSSAATMVPLGSLVVAVKLKESSSSFTSRSDRNRFSDAVSTLSSTITSGTLDGPKKEQLDRLHTMLSTLAAHLLSVIYNIASDRQILAPPPSQQQISARPQEATPTSTSRSAVQRRTISSYRTTAKIRSRRYNRR